MWNCLNDGNECNRFSRERQWIISWIVPCTDKTKVMNITSTSRQLTLTSWDVGVNKWCSVHGPRESPAFSARWAQGDKKSTTLLSSTHRHRKQLWATVENRCAVVIGRRTNSDFRWTRDRKWGWYQSENRVETTAVSVSDSDQQVQHFAQRCKQEIGVQAEPLRPRKS
jgi:hypothetical protein